ncbi:MAG TPA: putative DNA binding domain-containing protein [Bacteroidales bacterium]|nr:putative DNA binding domain-containing protein [Bacteroidales bacterium]HPL03629.1 putative DNA binding domain-containing protein [Bacteroidales bacterium]
MNALELLEIIGSGETSKVQFKQKLDNQDSFAAEMIAMSNSKGGIILVGVEDKIGKIVGLDYTELRKTNNLISTIANDHIKPLIYITTEVVIICADNESKAHVLVVYVEEGTNKPYKDNKGAIWIKQGSDKRRVTDNNEIIRLFQQSGSLNYDEMIVQGTTIADIDENKVREYLDKIIDIKEVELNEVVYKNLNILKDNSLTLGGLLFFAKDPQKYKPAFCIKAVSFIGNDSAGNSYRDSQDIVGTIPHMFNGAISFLTRNLQHIQKEKNFNSVGDLEISRIALEELLQNALTHRDYTKNSPIRLFIFDNRIEIISPGALPNSLTIENIKMGNAVVRNNLVVSYSSKLMNYRGVGTGVSRALTEQPNIGLENNVDGEQFKVIIPRPINR